MKSFDCVGLQHKAGSTVEGGGGVWAVAPAAGVGSDVSPPS
jgi:hypothetical protein